MSILLRLGWLGAWGLILPLCSGVPEWFLAPNQDPVILTGVGSAQTLSSAKADALRDLVSTLSVAVNSQMQLSQERQDSRLSSNTHLQVNLSTDNIHLQNVDVLNTKHSDGVFYVRLGVKKSALRAQFQSQMDAGLLRLQNLRLSECKILDMAKFRQLEEEMQDITLSKGILQAITKTPYSHPLITQAYEALRLNSPKPSAHVVVKDINPALAQSLLSELSKFFVLSQKDTSSNEISLALGQKGSQMLLDVIMKDCKKNIIFKDSIEFDAHDFARAHFIFYKRLDDFVKNASRQPAP